MTMTRSIIETVDGWEIEIRGDDCTLTCPRELYTASLNGAEGTGMASMIYMDQECFTEIPEHIVEHARALFYADEYEDADE